MASEPLMHYGSHGGAECGAHGDGRCDESTLTKDPALVTCPTCRGWLPIVANWKPKPLAAAPVPCAASPADPLDVRTFSMVVDDLRDLIRTEAGHIAYVNDELDVLLAKYHEL